MSEPEVPSADMSQLSRYFPDDAALIARMCAESADFRSMCEDLLLADRALVRFETLKQRRDPAKIAEYRQLVAELRKEIAESLDRCRPI
jgi:hypothetical protein